MKSLLAKSVSIVIALTLIISIAGCYQIEKLFHAGTLKGTDLCIKHNTSGLIAKQMPEISEDRIDEIYEGAELSDEELESLKSGIANSDESGWELHSGQYIKTRFGALYALYTGEDMGQGGANFELERVFANKKLALKYVSKKPMIALEKV